MPPKPTQSEERPLISSASLLERPKEALPPTDMVLILLADAVICFGVEVQPFAGRDLLTLIDRDIVEQDTQPQQPS